jgi:DNA topoisomerase-1
VLRDGESVKASIPKDAAPADLSSDQVENILRQKIAGPDELGRHPETGEPIFVLTGQYGPYLQLGEVVEGAPKPKRASLPKGVKPEDATLDMAVGLLSLPRTLGVHPADGHKVQAGLGRFGPYIVYDKGKEGKEYRSLKGEDDVLTVQLPRALELLAQPKQSRGRRTATPIRVLGNHPDDKQPIGLYEGQYGPYVKHGDVSASLPRGSDPAAFTAPEAIELLAAKRASSPRGRRGAGRSRKKKAAAT